MRARLPKAFSTKNIHVTHEEMEKIVADHFSQLPASSPYYTVLPSLDVVQKQIRWKTRHPAYSTNIRSSDAIGAWASQSRLYLYLRSGYTSRVMWGVREGLFSSESE